MTPRAHYLRLVRAAQSRAERLPERPGLDHHLWDAACYLVSIGCDDAPDDAETWFGFDLSDARRFMATLREADRRKTLIGGAALLGCEAPVFHDVEERIAA